MWLAIAASLQKMTVAPALAALPLCIISAKRHFRTSLCDTDTFIGTQAERHGSTKTQK